MRFQRYFTINFEKPSLWFILLKSVNIGKIWSTRIVQQFVIPTWHRKVIHYQQIKGVHTKKIAFDFSPLFCPVGLVYRIWSPWKSYSPRMDLSTNKCWSTSTIRPILTLLILTIKFIIRWQIPRKFCPCFYRQYSTAFMYHLPGTFYNIPPHFYILPWPKLV